MEKTLVIIKPDGVQRRLVGEIISRFEKKGLTIIDLKMIQLSKEKAERLYSPHKDKEFYKPLIEFMTSGPIVCMALAGEMSIGLVRKLVGATEPTESEPGSIRGDYSMDVQQNLVHASDSKENAQRELDIIFGAE